LRRNCIIGTVKRDAINTRDAALALVTRINRWFIGGAIVLSGAISLAAARSFHGHTSAASAASASAQSSASSSGSSSSGSGLQQPAQAPSPAQSSPAPVVSGGS
jgi:hypothetical protein